MFSIQMRKEGEQSMTQAEQLAAFVVRASYEDLSQDALAIYIFHTIALLKATFVVSLLSSAARPSCPEAKVLSLTVSIW